MTEYFFYDIPNILGFLQRKCDVSSTRMHWIVGVIILFFKSYLQYNYLNNDKIISCRKTVAVSTEWKNNGLMSIFFCSTVVWIYTSHVFHISPFSVLMRKIILLNIYSHHSSFSFKISKHGTFDTQNFLFPKTDKTQKPHILTDSSIYLYLLIVLWNFSKSAFPFVRKQQHKKQHISHEVEYQAYNDK